MQAALLTGRVPINRLIYVEDFCLISVGVEGVRRVLHYRDGSLVELYYIQLLLINPRLLSIIKRKIVHTSCVLCVPCGDDLLMICVADICC
jgi:hypothetical protein